MNGLQLEEGRQTLGSILSPDSRALYAAHRGRVIAGTTVGHRVRANCRDDRPCSTGIRREDSATQAVDGIVGEVDRFALIPELRYGDGRSEDFLLATGALLSTLVTIVG